MATENLSQNDPLAKKKKTPVTHMKTGEPHTDFALMGTAKMNDPNTTCVGMACGQMDGPATTY
jgi:hypothetical protein